MLRLWGAIVDGRTVGEAACVGGIDDGVCARTVAKPHPESPEVLIRLKSFM